MRISASPQICSFHFFVSYYNISQLLCFLPRSVQRRFLIVPVSAIPAVRVRRLSKNTCFPEKNSMHAECAQNRTSAAQLVDIERLYRWIFRIFIRKIHWQAGGKVYLRLCRSNCLLLLLFVCRERQKISQPFRFSGIPCNYGCGVL